MENFTKILNYRLTSTYFYVYLEVNGIHLECTNEEVVEVGLAVASGNMDYEELFLWVREHKV